MLNKFLVTTALSVLSVASVSCANKANSPTQSAQSTQDDKTKYEYLNVQIANDGAKPTAKFNIEGIVICDSESGYRRFFSSSDTGSALKVLPNQNCTIRLLQIELDGKTMTGNLHLTLSNNEIQKQVAVFKSNRRHVIEAFKTKDSGITINVFTNNIKTTLTTELTSLDDEVNVTGVNTVEKESTLIYSLDKFGISLQDFVFTAKLDNKIEKANKFYLATENLTDKWYDSKTKFTESNYHSLDAEIQLTDTAQFLHIVDADNELLEVTLVVSRQTASGYDWKSVVDAKVKQELESNPGDSVK